MRNAKHSQARPDQIGTRLRVAKMRYFVRRIEDWYSDSGRKYPWRRSTEPLFRVLVSEILLQRTRADAAAQVYGHFFERFPTWTDLAAARVVEIEEQLKPIGIWRTRAQVLSKLAKALERLGGKLPKTREGLELLPGFGQYVSNAAELFAFDRPRPLLDAGMNRVLSRFFGGGGKVDFRYDQYVQDLAQDIVALGDAKTVNWAILDLAGTICIPRNPRCGICPLSENCRMARPDKNTSAEEATI